MGLRIVRTDNALELIDDNLNVLSREPFSVALSADDSGHEHDNKSGQFTSTGHPHIDKALSEAKTVPEKVKAIYHSTRHYGDISHAGHGDGAAMQQEHLEHALKGSSKADHKAAVEAIGLSGIKKDHEKVIRDSVEDRMGSYKRATIGGLGGRDVDDARVKNEAQKHLDDAGYKKP